MYHNSTLYERATFLPSGARSWPAAPVSGMLGGEQASRASERKMMDEHDEPWPFYRHPRSSPRPGRPSREEGQERRIAEHVQRHRERRTPPPRRDRGLSRAEIVGTAIAVADAEGPDAISMRRIARELGAGAMSLYWYVASKEELLDLMLDAIEAEIEVPEPSGDWRADLGAFAHRTRAALSRHMWAIEFIGTRPPSGPNDVRNLERLLSLLDATGVDDFRVIMGVFMTVATFVIGAVMREAQELRFHREQERIQGAMTEAEVQAEHERFYAWFKNSDRYPHITRLMESGVDPDDPDTREERFQFSLDCVLDGIAARLALAARTEPASPPDPPARPDPAPAVGP